MTEEEIRQEAKIRAENLMKLKAKPGEKSTWDVEPKYAKLQITGKGTVCILCSDCNLPIRDLQFGSKDLSKDLIPAERCSKCRERLENPDSID